MKKYYLISFVIILCLSPLKIMAYTQDDCIKCHKEGSRESELHISLKEFENSIHGTISCADCHKGVITKEHEKVKGSGAAVCNQCHALENRHGINGKAENRPGCSSCHGSHGILGRNDKASMVNPGRFKETCKSCHPAESGENSSVFKWLPSVQIKSHKKEDFSRNYKRDNCTGCHQGQAAHGGKDPVSKDDCYKCHMNMKDNSITGYFHSKVDPGAQPVVYAAAIIYQAAFVLLVMGISGLLIRTSYRKLKERRK